MRHNGRLYRASREMADIFCRNAARVIENDDSELVVLAHRAGVDLLLITPTTPCLVTTQPDPEQASVLWSHHEPTRIAGTAGQTAASREDPFDLPASRLPASRRTPSEVHVSPSARPSRFERLSNRTVPSTPHLLTAGFVPDRNFARRRAS